MFSCSFYVILTNTVHMLDFLWDYFLQGTTEVAWYGGWVLFFQVERLSIFLSCSSDIFRSTICFSFRVFPDMWATGALYHETKSTLCLFFLLFSCLYVCHSVISPSMSPLSLCGFPQTITWLLLLDTISMDLRGWKTRLKETDWEMMMRAACHGEIDLFFPPFFPYHVGHFSSHLCFLHMQAVVGSPRTETPGIPRVGPCCCTRWPLLACLLPSIQGNNTQRSQWERRYFHFCDPFYLTPPWEKRCLKNPPYAWVKVRKKDKSLHVSRQKTPSCSLLLSLLLHWDVIAFWLHLNPSLTPAPLSDTQACVGLS